MPHARLLAVHTDRAAAHPGVVRVLTSLDIAGSNRLGIVRNHQPVLVDETIRHAGDAVALVVAESRETLREALELVTFDHEPLPGVFDPEQALMEGVPRIHGDNEEGNLMRAVRVRRGDPDGAFRGCDVVVEGVFETPRQEHAYLETEAGWARVDEAGVLVVVASTQTPYRDRKEIAAALGLEVNRVRVMAPPRSARAGCPSRCGGTGGRVFLPA